MTTATPNIMLPNKLPQATTNTMNVNDKFGNKAQMCDDITIKNLS